MNQEIEEYLGTKRRESLPLSIRISYKLYNVLKEKVEPKLQENRLSLGFLVRIFLLSLIPTEIFNQNNFTYRKVSVERKITENSIQIKIKW